MINNNKILTVSYGTFSCTLEGFDDSFGTMKAIAEYFRDLSADDRYFGAEPVQPDAQMLAHIAQREISRHVEAREDNGRIVLSAQSQPDATAMIEQAPEEDATAESAPAPKPTVKPAQRVIRKVGTPVIKPKPAEQAAPKVKVSVAPVVAAAVAQESITPEPEISETEVSEAVVSEAAMPEAPLETAAQALPETAPDTAADIVPSLPDEDVEAFFAEGASHSADILDAEDEDADNAPAQSRAKIDSIADKLSRIRAVVSKQSGEADAPDYSEDQHADAAVAPVSELAEDIADAQDDDADEVGNDVLAETLRDLEDALESDDEVEQTARQTDDEESEDDDIAAILNRLDTEAEATDGDPPHMDAVDEDDTDMGENILAAMDTLEANPGLDDLDDLADTNLFEEEDAVAAAPTPEPAPEQAAEPAAPRTRVLKVKRATLDAAIESGQLEEYDDEDTAIEKTPKAARSSLSDEAEQELARELAELEADMEAEDTSAQTAPEADSADPEPQDDDLLEDEAFFENEDHDEAQTDDGAAAKARAEIAAPAEADLSRLMEESNSQMEEPEAATRRDAFAHLRAAVASKKADEATGGASDEEETDEVYRDDLASVVRPRRPINTSEGARTQRPSDARPAPLKLVAEQRIDLEQQPSAAPVRPRRVSAMAPAPAQTATVAPADDTGSFAEFASEMGASSLPDLLEAAAAYLSFVEGYEEFSRPQLMTKVRQVEKDGFTREDSLRSFGKLLREGKIEKLRGGRFQASEHIGFKPDARAAG